MTRTFVIENTLKFPIAFWKDVLKKRKEISAFEECSTVTDCKYAAFNEDHYEWVGNWLYDDAVAPLLKKHKISGHVVYDGEGQLTATLVENGLVKNAKVIVSVVGV